MDKKIFIIEDDANILYGLAAKFGVSGFQIETDTGAGDITALMRKIKMFKPNFIILDLILPHADGFFLLEAIKSDKEVDSLNFVFTNLSDEDSRARGMKLGADYYFIKNDFSIDEFVKKVIKIIKNRKLVC